MEKRRVELVLEAVVVRVRVYMFVVQGKIRVQLRAHEWSVETRLLVQWVQGFVLDLVRVGRRGERLVSPG